MKPLLLTIPISHYGERARWALDLARVDYDEHHHLQLFSWGAAYFHARQKMLPVLRVGPTVLRSSGEIVAWAITKGAPLHPSAGDSGEVDALAERFAGPFGDATRRLGYDAMFRSLDTTLMFNAGRAPWVERTLLSSLRRPAIAFASRYLAVEPRAVGQARALVDRTLDDVAERLSDGRRYLCGDAFSAADLTFASMLTPVLLPAHHPVPLPQPAMLLAPDRAEVLRRRAHPAGAFALRLYAEERPLARGTYERQIFVRTRAAQRR